MILWMVFGLILVAGFFPKSSPGRMFRTALFGDPDRPDAKLRIPNLGRALIIGLVLMSLGPLVPAEFALIFAGDLATYLEVTMALMVLGAIGHVRSSLKAVAMFVTRFVRRLAVSVRLLQRRAARQRKIARTRGRSKPAKDKPGWAYAFA